MCLGYKLLFFVIVYLKNSVYNNDGLVFSMNKHNSFVKVLIKKVRRVKIATRLIIGFVALIIIPVIIISIFYNLTSYNEYEQITIEHMNKMLNQTSTNINFRLGNYLQELSDITTNLDMIMIMRSYNNLEVVDRIMASDKINSLLVNLIGSSSDVYIQLTSLDSIIAYHPWTITNKN